MVCSQFLSIVIKWKMGGAEVCKFVAIPLINLCSYALYYMLYDEAG